MRFHKLEEFLISNQTTKLWNPTALLALRQSQKFYAGDVDHLPRFGRGDERHGHTAEVSEFPRLPYQKCAFELVSNDMGYESPGTRVEGEFGHMIVIASEFRNDAGDDMLQWTPFNRVEADLWISVGQLILNRTAETFSFVLADNISDRTDANKERLGAWAGVCAGSTARFVRVLNCVNVKTNEVSAPVFLNRKRARKDKPLVYAYKTLVLKPTSSRRAALCGTHDSPAIHLRRGHIKHRRAGDFWWEPHVVGNRKRGIVMKDYRADELLT